MNSANFPTNIPEPGSDTVRLGVWFSALRRARLSDLERQGAFREIQNSLLHVHRWVDRSDVLSRQIASVLYKSSRLNLSFYTGTSKN